jgi:hypothetical protein
MKILRIKKNMELAVEKSIANGDIDKIWKVRNKRRKRNYKKIIRRERKKGKTRTMKEFRQNLCLIRRLKESFLNWKALVSIKIQKNQQREFSG